MFRSRDRVCLGGRVVKKGRWPHSRNLILRMELREEQFEIAAKVIDALGGDIAA
jgi:hypothetical protein